MDAEDTLDTNSIRIKRLEAMLKGFQFALDHVHDRRTDGYPFICHIIAYNRVEAELSREASKDCQSLVERALRGFGTLSAWMIVHNRRRRLYDTDWQQYREQWLRQLIRDIEAEIRRERDQCAR